LKPTDIVASYYSAVAPAY